MDKFSITQLTQFMTCPRAYYYIHILKFKLKKNENLIFGSAIHEALEAFYKRGDLMKTFRDYILSPRNDWQKPEGYTPDKHLEDGERLLTLYKTAAPYFEPLPDWIERREIVTLTHPVTGEPITIPFTFKIDLITKDRYIVDHKTSSSASIKQTEENKLQGIAYYMAHRSIFGVRPKGFIQNTIVKQKRNPRIIPTVFKYSLDDEVYLFDLLKHVLEMIEKREYLTAQPMLKTYYKCPIGVLCSIHGKQK